MNGGSRRRASGKSRRGNKRAGNKRRTAKKQLGGFGALSGIMQTALVPFGLYAAQKMVQGKKPRSGKSSRRFSRRR